MEHEKLFSRAWISAGVVLGALVLLYLGRVFTDAAIAAVVAGLIYYLSLPLVQLIEQWRIPRAVAILIAFLAFAAVFAFLLIFLIPILIEQLTSLAQGIPGAFDRAESWFRRMEARFGRQIGEQQLQEILNRATGRATEFVERAVSGFLGALSNILSALVVVIIGAVAAFYLLQDHDKIGEYAYRYVPDRHEPKIRSIAQGADGVLAGFLQGRIIIAAIVGTFTGVALSIIGVPYAFMLGVITGLFELIPYIGPILAAIPGVLIALGVSPITGLLAAVIYFVVQQVESFILTPRIVGAQVHLHPVTVIFAILIGGEILGVLGVFIAMPIAGIIKVILEQTLLSPRERQTEPRAEQQSHRHRRQ